MASDDELAALHDALRVSHASETALQGVVFQLEQQLRALQDQHAQLRQAYEACVAQQASLENHDE